MSTPKRVQMSRQRPWRADNPDAVIVARPSKWGNPFAAKIPQSHRGGPGEVGQATMTRQMLADEYREWLLTPTYLNQTRDGDWVQMSHASYPSLLGIPFEGRPTLEQIKSELAGRDLACWCPTSQPCHADVLLELANPVDPLTERTA
jgi:hypothetical protein